MRERNTKKAGEVCKIAHASAAHSVIIAGMATHSAKPRTLEKAMQHTRPSWRSFDPDLNRVDIHGNRPLKPHGRFAADIGALAFDMVLAGMKEAREASPRAHVIAYYRAQRSPVDGRSPVCWRYELQEADEQRRREAPARRAALFAELARIGKEWSAMKGAA